MKLVVYFDGQVIDPSEYRVIKFVQNTNKKGQAETKFEVQGLGIKVDGHCSGTIVK